MRVIYMGTPEFAVPPLKSIKEAGHEVVAVFTQPDKAKGRSKALVPTPVKQCALEYDIPVYQPERLRNEENVEIIRELAPDVIVVAAYGQILSEDILNIPAYGCVNIHASLLPKYRGAAPIERSIANGDSVTGVTTMKMAKGLDTGDMLLKAEVEITPTDTAATLEPKLSATGADLIIKTLDQLDTITPIPQNDADSTYAAKLTKEEGNIDFTKTATEIERLIRAFQPWPCAYTHLNGKTLKLFAARVTPLTTPATPGTITEVTKKTFTIACGQDALTVTNLQPEGKKPMDTAAFLNGTHLKAGDSVVNYV